MRCCGPGSSLISLDVDAAWTVTYDGLTAAELGARLKAPHCVVLTRVGSTLDLIHELAGQGAPAGTVVLADEQTSGRGREGRRWHSPPGVGIWLGYLSRPAPQAATGVLALRVGLALAATLRDLGANPALKWPNDVYLEDRKAAGVLCEARWSSPGGWVAVGVGINVHGPLPPELEGHAAAVDEVLPEITRLAILELLVPRLHRLDPSPVLKPEEQMAYSEMDWLCGRELAEPVRGRAAGVDRHGALLVDTPKGRQRILAGTVVAAR